MTIEELQKRVVKLEAEKEIQQLKAKYAALCDTGYDGDSLSALFTEDAVWNGGARFGVHEGRDAIKRYFDGCEAAIPWAIHYMVGPSIAVNEDCVSAAGTWYLWQLATLTVNGEPVPTWISGKYEDSYQYVDGVWKFSSVRLDFETISDTRLNWVDAPFAMDAPGAEGRA